MRLIINADDFGLTINVSKAILKGLKEGILTDTNALVNTPDFEASAKMALAFGIKEMGIHFLLTMGFPVLPKNTIPSLVNEKGKFYDREEFNARDVNIEEVEKELEAQIQKFLNSGLKVNHLTTHHAFMNKSQEMTDLFIKLSKKYHVPLRNEASRYGSQKLVEYYQSQGILMPDYVYFNRNTPYHTPNTIKEYLKKAVNQFECLEIGCHPGYSDDNLRRISLLNDDREKEMEAVMDEDLKDFISKQNITRISFSDL